MPQRSSSNGTHLRERRLSIPNPLCGVVLAGGLGKRLRPLSQLTNKHLLAVGTEPMIWHPIKQLVSAGVHDIMVITSREHMGPLVNALGSGRRFGATLTYRVQEGARGIADALRLAEDFARSRRVVVILGDNIFERSIAPYVKAFCLQSSGARVLLKEVGDPQRFGIAALDEQQILQIEEKPRRPKSSYAVVGCYMYDNQLFRLLAQVRPSARGEYEITAVNNLYIRRHQLQYSIVDGRWTDAGTFESLREANDILFSNRNRLIG